MRKLSLLLPLLLIGCNSSEVETISTPYQALESTDIQSDNSDLANLITATRGYDIVTLGESSHQGSKVFSLRGRMVKALHQEGDADLLVMEAGFYDGLAAWQNYLTSKQTLLDAITGPDANYMFMYRFSKEMAELFNYIHDVDQQGTNPLILAGYEARITSDAGCSVMFDELKRYLNNNGLPLRDYADIQRIAPVMMCPWYAQGQTFTMTDHNTLVAALNKLEDTLAQQKPKETIPAYDPSSPRDFKQYASFWLQIARSLSAQSFQVIHNEAYEYSDYQSAENLKWLREEWFNIDGQTLLWGHNIHVTPLSGSVVEATNERYPDTTIYNVMQLTHTGRLAPFDFDTATWESNTIPVESVSGSLNHILYQSGYPDAFIDIKGLTGEDRAAFDSAQRIKTDFGSARIAIPSKIMDGILFIPTETPTTARPM